MTLREGCGIVGSVAENVRKIKLLRHVEDAKGKKFAPGTEHEVMMHGGENSKGLCYMLHASGVRLYPHEYAFVIDDAEFDELLGRRDDESKV